MGRITTLFVIFQTVSIFYWHLDGKIIKRAGDNSQWCCEIEPQGTYVNITTIAIKQFTKIIWEEQLQPASHLCGPEDHFWGQRSCEEMKNVSRIVTRYKQVPEIKQIFQQGVCPKEHTVCCDGYVMHEDQCLKPDTLNALQALLEAGLVG